LRVSTGEQTVANQERELAETARRHGWQIVATYRDEGISGAKGREKRPGFDRLCKATRAVRSIWLRRGQSIGWAAACRIWSASSLSCRPAVASCNGRRAPLHDGVASWLRTWAGSWSNNPHRCEKLIRLPPQTKEH